MKTVNLVRMTLVVIPLMFWQIAGAQDAGAPGCGDPKVKFDVATARRQAKAKPEDGKALVYLLQNDENFNSVPRPTNRFGVDGQWVGATHNKSYLAIQVTPGVHHLCTQWQFRPGAFVELKSRATRFNTEAGGVYYFEVKDTFLQGETGRVLDVSLGEVDSDEGQLMVGKFAEAVSKAK